MLSNPWAVIFKNQFSWGVTSKEELHSYVPTFISKKEYKDITGEDY